ncbi:MAG: hypothetical protein ABSC05_18380, partial [Candidatus Solibacter sp.]
MVAFIDDLALELGKRQEDVQRQAPDGSRRIELLGGCSPVSGRGRAVKEKTSLPNPNTKQWSPTASPVYNSIGRTRDAGEELLRRPRRFPRRIVRG